jgi:hypothetical protein
METTMAKPAAAAHWERDREEQRRQAVQWVIDNMRKIRGRAAKFQRYSPYDLDDFIQQAYAAALAAVDVSIDQGIPFEACFWVLFTADSRTMASNPVTRNRYQEFRENYTEWGYAPTPTQDLFQDFAEETGIGKEELEMVEALIDMALQLMTPKQRKVWRYLLSDTYYTTTDIAEILSVKRQVVEELRDTGLKRVRRYFEAGA